MRSKFVVLVGMLCLFAASAFADIVRISPTSFTPSGEDFLTIYGSDLTGTNGTLIVFDDLYIVDEPNFVSPTEIVTWIPTVILSQPGLHSVTVRSIDATAERTHGPALFTVGGTEPTGPPVVVVPEGGVSAEALNTEGAFVEFSVFAYSANGDPIPVSCDHASGSQFALGFTPVVCTASDAQGSASGSFNVFVTDTTPPVVTVPDDIDSATPVVTWVASAVDNLAGALPVTCSPASGSSFPVGKTRVTCSAEDNFANTGTASFIVFITTGPPLLDLPSDISDEATGPAGAVVGYEASSAGGGSFGCAPASGSTFPIGTTVVTCTATNGQGTVSGNFNVIVHDTLGPVLTLPSQITTRATSPAGAIVAWNASAVDAVDGAHPVTCSPVSGSQFEIGQTAVVCTSTDSRGNVGVGGFEVSIVEIADDVPPVLMLPAVVRVPATSSAGAIVSYTATAVDDVDGAVPIHCTPVSGSQFPIGTTPVVCTASDVAGNVATGGFNVIVEDKTPPVLTLPSGVRVEATSPNGATVPYTASANDAIDGPVAIQCSPASGSLFAIGTTSVTCTASDSHGNNASGSFDVVVEDTTPPVIVSISATPGVLWPPNHQMVNVVVAVTAVDAGDAAPVSRIVAVASNQPENGLGDGDMGPDWNVTGPLTLQLRAERAGSAERIYTITVECTDASGNVTSATVTVAVRNTASRSRAVR